MNYAQQLRDNYFKNKDMVSEQRKKQHLSELTLEDKLNDGYKAYKKFCFSMGITPKKMIDFLRAEVSFAPREVHGVSPK